jgi:putative DNA primase/helicase
MAADFSNTGAFNVNGQWVTALRYEAALLQGAVEEMQLRFMNGRSEVASVRLSAGEARELLGDRNYAAVLKTATDAQGPGRDRGAGGVKGELRGKSLEFRQVTLSGYEATQAENAIFLDSRVRAVAGPANAQAGEGGREDRPTIRDDVVDASHAMQSAVPSRGLGDPAVQGATRAAGVADAAKLALDAAESREARLRRTRRVAVPQEVADKFLKVDDKFFFPDKTLAFTDRGTKLKAETHNLEVIRSLVSIAESRGWEALSVTGTGEFRKEIWREASLRGIEVRGYEPTELEREALRRAMDKRHGPNEIHREAPQRGANRPQDASQHEDLRAPSGRTGERRRARDPGASREQADARSALITGSLIAAGAAPYQFDPKEKPSYYLKIQTERGERVVWGVDLERALAQSKTQVQVGDEVALENQGSKPVVVKVAERDRAGKVVGEKGISTHRNTWVVEKPSYFDERAEKAAAFRNGERAKEELVVQYPDLTNAIATMRLGELFAEKLIDRPEDRERLVSALRETLARSLERGDTIQAPKIKEDAVRKLDRISGEIDEVAQREAAAGAEKVARSVGARRREPPQHVRA